MFTQELKETGLKEKEALIYDLLIDKGILPVKQIVSLSGLKRGIAYKTLYDLCDKGLVTQETIKNKLHFKCAHPFQLSKIIEQQLKTTQANQLTLQALLPQLVSAFNTSQNKPGVKVFEGVEGIKDIYNDTLREGKEISAILQTAQVNPKIYLWLNSVYAKERTKANIWANVITAQDEKTKIYVSRNEDEKRETRVVPKEKFPIGIELDIYGDKVAFINFNKENDLIGILIQNKLIADTMRAIFNLAWESATKYDN